MSAENHRKRQARFIIDDLHARIESDLKLLERWSENQSWENDILAHMNELRQNIKGLCSEMKECVSPLD